MGIIEARNVKIEEMMRLKQENGELTQDKEYVMEKLKLLRTNIVDLMKERDGLQRTLDEEQQQNESLKKAVSDIQSRQWTELLDSRAITRDVEPIGLTARNRKLESDLQKMERVKNVDIMEQRAFLMNNLKSLRDELLSLRTNFEDQTKEKHQLEMRCDALQWLLDEERAQNHNFDIE